MQPPLTQRSPQAGFLTIAQLTVSSLGLVGASAGAGLLLIVGLVNLINNPGQDPSAVTIFSMAWVCILIAALALPSLFFSIQRLRGIAMPVPRINSFRIATIFILIWPLVLVLGSWASTQGGLSWLILPPLQVLAVGLPVWWIVEFVRRGLPVGSLQRGWGIVNFSLLLTTPLVVVVEIFAFLLLLVIFILWTMSQPALLQEIESLTQNMLLAQSDPEALLPVILPYLQKPVVIFGILAGLSGLIPLIEEFFKPLALWVLIDRKLTPAEGFVAGALCGMSFALLESLLSLTNPAGQSWLITVIGRAGTGILHITTSALIGWAIASARQKGSYFQLFLVYLFSAGLHGLWNALSLFWGMSILFENTPEMPRGITSLAKAAPLALIPLALSLFALLWAGRRRLQHQSPPEAPVVYNSP